MAKLFCTDLTNEIHFEVMTRLVLRQGRTLPGKWPSNVITLSMQFVWFKHDQHFITCILDGHALTPITHFHDVVLYLLENDTFSCTMLQLIAVSTQMNKSHFYQLIYFFLLCATFYLWFYFSIRSGKGRYLRLWWTWRFITFPCAGVT